MAAHLHQIAFCIHRARNDQMNRYNMILKLVIAIVAGLHETLLVLSHLTCMDVVAEINFR